MGQNMRAWYVPGLKSKWMCFNLVVEDGKYVFYHTSPQGSETYFDVAHVFHNDSWIVEQSLGLYDEEGIEIFEGDIVEYELDFTCIGMGLHKRIKAVCCDNENLHELGNLLLNGGTVRIIGNIHENEELLVDI